MLPCDEEGYFCTDLESHYDETWRAMEALVDKGKIKSIGLSNFNKTQIREILNLPKLKYKPTVVQNESHPYLHEKDMRDFCRINGIIFQVWLLNNFN
jgi:alcohol dehydrogenase (NADP+)